MKLPLKYKILRFIGHRHGLPGRDRILRAFAHPDRQPSRRFEVPFFGLTYSGDLASYIDWMVYFYGAYSRSELTLLDRLATALRAKRDRLTFFDIGANVGQHTMFMARLADAVYAFEPFERVAAEIRRKISRNGLANVHLNQVALSDTDGEATFYPPESGNLGTGSLVGQDGLIPADKGFKVPTRRGDAYFAQLNAPRIDILKIDVEGHEAAVFSGLRQRLLSDRPVIMMEISGPSRSGFLTESGFRSALYPDHVLFEVTSDRAGYKLAPFAFERAHEVLCLPSELADLVAAGGR